MITKVWIVDFHKSDPWTHIYCDACHNQIPDFLIRYDSLHEIEDWSKIPHNDFDYCEGCGARLHPHSDVLIGS